MFDPVEYVAGRVTKAKRRRGQGRSTKWISQSVGERIEKTSGTRARAAGDRDCERRVFIGTRRGQHHRFCRRTSRSLRTDIQGCWWVRCLQFFFFFSSSSFPGYVTRKKWKSARKVGLDAGELRGVFSLCSGRKHHNGMLMSPGIQVTSYSLYSRCAEHALHNNLSLALVTIILLLLLPSSSQQRSAWHIL